MKTSYILLIAFALLVVCSSLMAATITWSVTTSPANSATISVTANGQVVANPAKFVVQPGTVIDIPNVTSAAGYYFDSAKKDGKVVYKTDLPFIADTKSHKVILYFKKNPVITSSASPKAGGTITPLGKVPVEYGSDQEFIIAANTGYEVKSLKVNGKLDSLTNDTYTFNNVIKANTIAVTFAIKSYTVTSSVTGGHGKISPAGTKKVNNGSSLNYTATPDKGYKSVIYVDGAAVLTGLESKSLKYTLANITSNHVVDSKFILASTVFVTGVTINKTALTLNKGASETLAATVNPSNAANKAVTWSSSNNAVVTVNSSGLVTAVTLGSSTITVTTTDGGFTASCLVTVTANAAYTGVMIFIPAGDFLMGNSGIGADASNLNGDELPQHTVTLSDYYISMYEVTRGEYKQFINAGGYTNPSYWSAAGWYWKADDKKPHFWDEIQTWASGPTFTQTDNHPAVGVSYFEAEAFCNWAGGHLPTEAQWERVARWDTLSNHPNIYPWGDVWDVEKCNNYFDNNSAGGGYQHSQTAPVGSYSSYPSPSGCQDMAGNVWEWCQDWYKSYPGSSSQFDYTDSFRVVRGGGWDGGDDNTYRGACRSLSTPSNYFNYIGFRLAR